MDLTQFKGLWDIITSFGAVLIPLALYYIKTEVRQGNDRVEKKLDIHIQSFKDHVNTDENYQERTEKTFDSIKKKLNII